MTRFTATFAKLRPALVTFITAGDGDTAANLDALVAGGADVIELGMPFTDPMADGPAIQAANLRALGKGTTTADIFGHAAAFRARSAAATPAIAPPPPPAPPPAAEGGGYATTTGPPSRLWHRQQLQRGGRHGRGHV